MTDYPKDKDSWWALVEENWDRLKYMIRTYHPACECLFAGRMTITAPRAEAVCANIREEIAKESGMKFVPDDPVEQAEAFRRVKSDGLVSILNNTWFGIPESMEAHSIPGFGALCDLCSEADVLEEQDREICSDKEAQPADEETVGGSDAQGPA